MEGSKTPTSPPAIDLDTAPRLRAVIGRITRRLRPTPAGTAAGLTPTKRTVLMSVVREGPVRLADVADAEGINPTMLSRIVGALVEEGLIERSSDEGDRRAAWLRATPNGRKLVERIRRERTDALLVGLGELDLADRRAIEKALPALEELSEQLRGDRR